MNELKKIIFTILFLVSPSHHIHTCDRARAHKKLNNKEKYEILSSAVALASMIIDVYADCRDGIQPLQPLENHRRPAIRQIIYKKMTSIIPDPSITRLKKHQQEEIEDILKKGLINPFIKQFEPLVGNVLFKDGIQHQQDYLFSVIKRHSTEEQPFDIRHQPNLPIEFLYLFYFYPDFLAAFLLHQNSWMNTNIQKHTAMVLARASGKSPHAKFHR